MNGYFFFFSSRRRHTRLQGDWSSDVCSSDLRKDLGIPYAQGARQRALGACRDRHRQSHGGGDRAPHLDRKSTRLNSSHLVISYAVFCLKKKIDRKRLSVPLIGEQDVGIVEDV